MLGGEIFDLQVKRAGFPSYVAVRIVRNGQRDNTHVQTAAIHSFQLRILHYSPWLFGFFPQLGLEVGEHETAITLLQESEVIYCQQIDTHESVVMLGGHLAKGNQSNPFVCHVVEGVGIAENVRPPVTQSKLCHGREREH